MRAGRLLRVAIPSVCHLLAAACHRTFRSLITHAEGLTAAVGVSLQHLVRSWLRDGRDELTRATLGGSPTPAEVWAGVRFLRAAAAAQRSVALACSTLRDTDRERGS